MLPRILSRVVGWAKANDLYNLEFKERGVSLWAFMRTWEKDTFHLIAVAVTDHFSSDAIHDLSVMGSVMAAAGGSVSLVAVSGGSHVLADTYGGYLGSGYCHKLVEYPIFDLRLLKRCLQKVSCSVCGSFLDDRIFCHALEVVRASPLDDVTFQCSSCHYHRGAVDAVASWGHQQRRGSVASHRGLP